MMGGGTLLTIVPRNVLGKGMIFPSNELTKGIIGVGGMGRNHIPYNNTRVVALKISLYHDFRDLILDKNVDIVHIATPPHWHGIISVEAAKGGKDIFCFKDPFYGLGTPVKPLKKLIDSGLNIRIKEL